MDDVEKYKANHLLTETQRKLLASDEKLKLSNLEKEEMRNQLNKFRSELTNFGNAKPNLLTNIIIANNQKKKQKALETQARIKEQQKNDQITKSKEKALREFNICPSPTQPKSLFPEPN